jgi:putative ABC transport system permease protein
VMLMSPTRIARGPLPPSEFLDYQGQTDVFEDVAGTVRADMMLTTREGAELVSSAVVTPNTFTFLGVPPVLGQTPSATDATGGDAHVVAISQKLWLTEFGGAPDIIGRTMILDDAPYTIVAVMPPRFAWHVADVWVPRAIDRRNEQAPDARRWFQAHLKPGVTLQQAEAQLNVIAARRAREHPQEYPAQTHIGVIRVIDFVVRDFRGVLYALFAAVSLLLLIACSNVANMLLARATAREREMTVRAALGASRMRLVRQLLLESTLLACGGAAAGCLLAYAGLQALLRFVPRGGIAYEVEIRLDSRVLLVSLGLSALAALIVGLFPALHGARQDLVAGLKDTGKGTGSGSRYGRVRDGLVIAEIALSLALLIGAGLLLRTFFALTRIDLGLRSDHVLLASPRFPPGAYTTGAQRHQFFDQLRQRIAALPGVSAVAESTALPPFLTDQTELEIPGKIHTDTWLSRVALCSDRYFDVFGVHVTKGRALSASDITGARRVAIVNQTFVSRYFGAEDPIGKTIVLSRLEKRSEPVAHPLFEIVGVIADYKNDGLRAVTQPEAYVPSTVTGSGRRFLLTRTSVDPQLLAPEVGRQVWMVSPSVATSMPATYDAQILRTYYEQPRFTALVLTVFAATGLLLVAAGVYGVMAYAVARRTQEIAIRVALGGERRHVLRLVLRQGLGLVAAGIGAGLLLSVIVNQLVRANWWDPNTPADPWTAIAAVLVIVSIGCMACYWPARRALHVDPLVALRRE